uniref:Uncharacterized protein n=1 Tax=Ulva picorna-like virus 5 TaxID=3051533 RepID=A0A9Y1YTR6_9VIRU|nr:MAG: hypothetical protein [Ulva picorna-like virus 5]
MTEPLRMQRSKILASERLFADIVSGLISGVHLAQGLHGAYSSMYGEATVSNSGANIKGEFGDQQDIEQEEQQAVFEDQVAVDTVAVPGHADFQNKAFPYEVISAPALLQRAYFIAKVDFKHTDNAADIRFSFDIVKHIMSNSNFLVKKLSGFRYLRATASIQIRTSSMVTCAGLYNFYWQPPGITWTVNDLQLQPAQVLNIGTQETISIDVPFMHPLDWFDLASFKVDEMLGKLIVRPVVPVYNSEATDGTCTCPVTMYAELRNVQMALPYPGMEPEWTALPGTLSGIPLGGQGRYLTHKGVERHETSLQAELDLANVDLDQKVEMARAKVATGEIRKASFKNAESATGPFRNGMVSIPTEISAEQLPTIGTFTTQTVAEESDDVALVQQFSQFLGHQNSRATVGGWIGSEKPRIPSRVIAGTVNEMSLAHWASIPYQLAPIPLGPNSSQSLSLSPRGLISQIMSGHPACWDTHLMLVFVSNATIAASFKMYYTSGPNAVESDDQYWRLNDIQNSSDFRYDFPFVSDGRWETHRIMGTFTIKTETMSGTLSNSDMPTPMYVVPYLWITNLSLLPLGPKRTPGLPYCTGSTVKTTVEAELDMTEPQFNLWELCSQPSEPFHRSFSSINYNMPKGVVDYREWLINFTQYKAPMHIAQNLPMLYCNMGEWMRANFSMFTWWSGSIIQIVKNTSSTPTTVFVYARPDGGTLFEDCAIMKKVSIEPNTVMAFDLPWFGRKKYVAIDEVPAFYTQLGFDTLATETLEVSYQPGPDFQVQGLKNCAWS